MSDRDQEPMESSEVAEPFDADITEQGFTQIDAKTTEAAEPALPGSETSLPTVRQAGQERQLTPTTRLAGRAGTIEHLAARRAGPAPNLEDPEIKRMLSVLRTDITDMVTGLRWGGQSVTAIAERMIPALNVGPVAQWYSVLIPFLLEIDRAGNLLPVWLEIIEREETHPLATDANPAETELGRARRFAILMLGNYKYVTLEDNATHAINLTTLLGELALDPNTSLYATESLVKQGTTAAIQTLISALKDAEGWAKVDIVEACLALNLTNFYPLLLASGFNHASGLESYIAIPLYRNIALGHFLQQENKVTPRIAQQAALIFAQVLQDSRAVPQTSTDALPIAFERPLPSLVQALFEGARKTPTWHYAFAIHHLGMFLGRYWSGISQGKIQNTRITEQVYPCLPLMPEIERWMDGPGREALLQALAMPEPPIPVLRAINDLRDPRAISPLLAHLDSIKSINGREQALTYGAICDALGHLGDRRALSPLLQLLERSIPVGQRIARAKRADNLPIDDPEVAGSILFGAIVRAFGLLGDQHMLETVLRAANDFDPYVRVLALHAIKPLDPKLEDTRSLLAAREALNDPNENVIRAACQLLAYYHDRDSIPLLRQLVTTRPLLAPVGYDTLRQLDA